MPDIRDVLKGLSVDDRALYQDVRTQMRRAYLYAHSKILPIDKYDHADDAFLDLIDIKIALLFDRAGVFNHVEGNLENPKPIEDTINQDAASAATRMLINQWPNQAKQ
jgi:hypothetical protein